MSQIARWMQKAASLHYVARSLVLIQTFGTAGLRDRGCAPSSYWSAGSLCPVHDHLSVMLSSLTKICCFLLVPPQGHKWKQSESSRIWNFRWIGKSNLSVSGRQSPVHWHMCGLADTHPHTLTCSHTHTHAHTRIHTHARTHPHPHAQTHTHTHTYTQQLTHAHTHTRTHTHTHTHTHTPLPTQRRFLQTPAGSRSPTDRRKAGAFCTACLCFKIDLVGECLKCFFQLTRGGTALVV